MTGKERASSHVQTEYTAEDGGCAFREDARLVQVARFLGGEVDWRPLHSQGDANPVLWGSFNRRTLVLRLNADAQSAFGADRNMEWAVLKAIKHYSWSPDILHYALDEGWCLMEHHGLSLDQFGDEESTHRIAGYDSLLLAAVKDMQRIQEVPEFDYNRLFRYYRQRFQHMQDHQHLMQLEDLIDDFFHLPQTYGCLVHHDLHQGNFCLDQGRLVILDWEYAGRGNPWLDMAAIVRFHRVTGEDVRQLPVCEGLAEDQISRFLELATKVNLNLESLWIAARKSA